MNNIEKSGEKKQRMRRQTIKKSMGAEGDSIARVEKEALEER